MADLINLTALAPPSSLLVPTKTVGTIASTQTMPTAPNSKHLLSGALTADTYLELVSLSTPGWLRVCGVNREDATSRTLGLKIIIDGTTVIDAVDAAIGSTGVGWYAIGGGTGATIATIGFEGIRFNASLSLQIKSSITETDKIALVYLTAVV